MKSLSVEARNVCRSSFEREAMRSEEEMERRRESFSAAGRLIGMEWAVQRSLN